MDPAHFNVFDGRRLEVVADGLSLWQGAQLAIGTTMSASRWVGPAWSGQCERRRTRRGLTPEGAHLSGAVR